MRWVEAAFPDLDSRAYFLPPVYVNRVPMTRQAAAGQEVLVLQQASGRDKPSPTKSAASRRSARLPIVQDSDLRDDEAMQRIFMCLQTMSEQNREVMVGISQLQFGQSKGYRTLSWHSAAAALLPEPADLSPDQIQNMKEGDFDFLLIHRHYGFVIFEVKSTGRFKISQENLNELIRRKISDAIKQLNNAKANLLHLVKDIAPHVRITKMIAVPNLKGHQVQQALSGDHQLATDLCRCLGTTDSPDITGLCLCSDQLSDPKTPSDVSSHVLRELGHWWQRRVAGAGPDSHMTPELYKSLVARFCGPATIVTVPCTSPPRLSVKTLGQAVSYTGECYTAQITLFPEQVHLLNMSPPIQFVTGPPGTGKTVVLMLTAMQWLDSGHHVYIVSTWLGNRAACFMLYHLLLNTLNTCRSADVPRGQPHLLLYDFDGGKDVENAVNDLSQAASGESLYVIADEVGLELGENNFQIFCDKLLERFPDRLHLWAASCFHGHAPADWPVKYLTRPLRSPPSVIREYERARSITELDHVQPYSERGVPDHTDGPPVKRLYHRGQGQLGDWPGDCVTCGREVASFLHSLRVGAKENVTMTSATTVDTTPPCLQWRDVLVLYWVGVNDNSGVVRALRGAGIPVRVMKNNDDDFEDVAKARSDVVWVALGDQVRGLERKIVVCLDDNARLHCMSRCTSQLVIISDGDILHKHDSDFDTCHLS
ncbi:uncharacterized protein LOC112576041 [Pomacea canaliculata]|uniref:uncharacterized protein LOC112576041 n=1 Tax=Pomacea canaliculata TaxID=400727 RepID=UPI000D73AA19|nr:uncharacterized protein LOC112576041 [Pomacea canaliculata]